MADAPQTSYVRKPMPKELHDTLAHQAAKKGLKGDRKDAYVYGTMNKIEKGRKAAHRGASKSKQKMARGGY